MAVKAEVPAMSKELLAFIDEWKVKPGNLIMILHKVQGEFGYIPRSIAFKLGEMLDVPIAKIYGVLSFYHFFKTEKPGKHTFSVCMGTACYLKGGQEVIDELETLMGVSCGGTSEDGQFSLEAVRCVGCCGLAPLLTVGNEVHGKLGMDELPEIVAQFKD